MSPNNGHRKAITVGALALAGGMALVGCSSAPVRGTPTPFSLGGGSLVLGFTPTPTAATPKVTPAAAAPSSSGGGGGPEDKGKQVFLSAGCIACHTLQGVPGAVGQVGPKLTGVGTRAGTRKPGTDAEAYIRESVLRPAAFVVPDFPPVMPEGLVKEGPDLDALVAFLLTQK